LSSIRTVGPYTLDSLLGVGGMGEVYRARDSRLGRDVAIKILPAAFAGDRERLARFKREAQVLASLNHPNIAAIYGFEAEGGIEALVLELVEGPTLADRLAVGALPVTEALAIAEQIAEALTAAHAAGVVHRDLKPANIKLRDDGTVKVLDFGLAKASTPVGSAPDVAQSPTITTPAMMTGAGVILGTAAYMSPEQARGKTVDKRADIWAFGAVLFEMLTGKRAFYGEDVGDTLAAVLRTEPDWNALPAEAAFPVRTLLRGCLEKDPRQRVGDISAALFVLRHQAAGVAIENPPIARHALRADARRVALFTAAALIVGAATAGTGVWLLTRPAAPAVVRTTITTSGSAAFVPNGLFRDVTITPDGSRVVYPGDRRLLVRALNDLQPTELSDVGVPNSPFVSPDGLWIGFFDGFDTIKKVSITGGPSQTVCATGQGAPAGATWGPDGSIIFATSAPTGLQHVPAKGGQPTELTRVDRERGEDDHVWPEFLPGGEAALFTIVPANRAIENAQIAVLDLRTGSTKVLINGGSHAHYVPTGHLVYGVGGTLRAVAFDLARLEVIPGTPAPVLDGVTMSDLGAVDVAVAANGSLVYVSGAAGDGGRQTVVSVDRQGRASPLPGLPLDAYRHVRVSPDGTRLALATRDDVWIYDFARATLRRLTTDPAPDTGPLWTPDGQGIIFTSRRAGYPELFRRQADGAGSDERLPGPAKDLLDLWADGWSKDGTQLLFSEVPPNIQCATRQVAIEPPSDATLLVKHDACNLSATVSPNGRWIAYTANRAGRTEIYVDRYPELGNRQLIVTGGLQPIWSQDGQELSFISPAPRQVFVVAVPVQSGRPFGRPQLLFEFPEMFGTRGGRPYDVAPDGRFLIIRSAPDAAVDTERQIVFVQNWFTELKQRVSTELRRPPGR
jgi:serine/threonine-protein kinase